MPSMSAGGGAVRRRDRDGGDPLRAVELDADEAVADAVVVDGARRAASARCPCRCRCASTRRRIPWRARRRLASSLLFGTISSTSRHSTARLPLTPSSVVQNTVGVVAAHLALVGDAREPAGAGQHREQRHFRQRHGGGAVVDQHDVVGGERQLIAAAGRGAVDRRR